MTTFLSKVLTELQSRQIPVSDYIFILPGKRAGSYLNREIAKQTESPVFAPEIYSIEAFAEKVSGLESIDNLSVLFEFYSVYIEATAPEKRESFETFSSWAGTLLADFNEIDRYLIDAESFFGYLGNIQEIQHWYLQKERTPLMENYITFWKQLPQLYLKLQSRLQNKEQGYQGMIYRKAAANIGSYTTSHSKKHIFVGFNALNNAEQQIFQEMKTAGIAEIFWDIDKVLLKDENHDASLFIREYLNSWPVYQQEELKIVSEEFSRPKRIDIVGIPKNIGQAKYIGELLAGFSAEELKNTAIVLGDEKLLIPILNSLPPLDVKVNVTMGFPLKESPLNFFFEHLLKFHSNPGERIYYKEVTDLCTHPVVLKITSGFSNEIVKKIEKENLIYLDPEEIFRAVPEDFTGFFKICFGRWENDPALAIENLQELIFVIKDKLNASADQLYLEFLFQYHKLLNKLKVMMERFQHISSIKTLLAVFEDVITSETVDFAGNPFEGLQIMGMLESRVLDFKNIILTSVNEGILPAGKTSNSFIPFDLKYQYKLPTYKEKDAIYTYHFYHLLQRSEKAFLLYNNDNEGFNAGEKSRFLLQLKIDQQENHTIKDYIYAPKVPALNSGLKEIKKSPEILQKIKERAERGFSPSALTLYIRNPIDFYYRYILGVQEEDALEETVAFNTLGTVVHKTLENLYRPWIEEGVTPEYLKEAIKRSPAEVSRQFKECYTKQPLDKGKNLLIFEVAKRYVANCLKREIKELEQGNHLEILQVENKLKAEISVPGLDFPIFLKGEVDRIDKRNGITRIIDYKTGKVQQNQVEISEWEDLNSDYDKYSKTFQVLSYAYLLNHQDAFNEPVEAGIISFKNLKGGFLKFSRKEGKHKNSEIDQEVLTDFKIQLEKLITEICDPEVPFLEKKIK